MISKLYIAYGSNLNLEQMEHRCPFARVVGKSEIKDYALVFRGSRSGAVATIEPCKDSFVPVLIWRVTKHDERALDIYEGYPKFYDKKVMDIVIDDKTVSAMVYVMTQGHRLGYPSKGYYNTIKDGYKAAGFDTDILKTAIDYTEKLMQDEYSQKQQNIYEFNNMNLW